MLRNGCSRFSAVLKNTDRYTVAKDIRRCTVTLIDDCILIDCGPHLMDELTIHGIDPQNIDNILVTHTHPDHFSPNALRELQQSHGGLLHVWHNMDDAMPQLDGIVFHPMQLHHDYLVDGLTVTPLGANHNKGAVHYSIAQDGKKLFYGCDGAWFLMETFRYMKNQNYDAMILDATVGDYLGDYRLAEHNSIPMIRMMIPSFMTWSISGAHTKIVLDHLARTLHKSHRETCEAVKEDGFIVAYDGMSFEI